MKNYAAAVVAILAGVMIYDGNIRAWIFSKFGGADKDALKFDLATIKVRDAEKNFDSAAIQLVDAFRKIGFAYLDDIPGFDPDSLLTETKWLFSLGETEKMRLMKHSFNPQSSHRYRGYFPVRPGGSSHKEAFEMGMFEQENENLSNTQGNGQSRRLMREILQEPNTWPVTSDSVRDMQFKVVTQQYFPLFANLAKFVMELTAHGLGLNRTYFSKLYLPHEQSTLRMLHYPSRMTKFEDLPEHAKDGDVAIVTAAHYDTSMLTLLAVFDNPGLQIKPEGFDQWYTVPAKRTGVLVNIGDLLMKMTENQIIATNHRVIDIGTDRYSVAFFYEPDFDANIGKTIYGNDNPMVGEFNRYGPWMANRTKQFYEYATTDFGILD